MSPSTMMMTLLLSASVVVVTSLFLRLLYVLPSIHPTRPTPRRRGTPARLLVVLGSGGHTAEMLALLRDLDTTSYTHRSYLVSAGDAFSHMRAHAFEAALAGSLSEPANYDISVIPRARKIHQPLITTPVSTVRCLVACFQALRGPSRSLASPLSYPDLVVTNGPGTAVCVVYACLLLRFCGVGGTTGKLRTIYVESWARVRRLSLSGRLLLPCVDRFLVQWEGLKGVGGRGEYIGVLV